MEQFKRRERLKAKKLNSLVKRIERGSVSRGSRVRGHTTKAGTTVSVAKQRTRKPKLPMFSPVFTEGEVIEGGLDESATLGITVGKFHGPHVEDGASKKEIPSYHLYPFTPEMDSDSGQVSLAEEEPPIRTLTHGSNNTVFLEVTLVKRGAVLGATTVHAGTTGLTVWTETSNANVSTQNEIQRTLWPDDSGSTLGGGRHKHDIPEEKDFPDPGDDHDHGGFTDYEGSSDGITGHRHPLPETDLPQHTHPVYDAGHDHQSQLNIQNVVYHISTLIFKFTTASDPPDDSELIHNIKWGSYDLDGDGKLVDGEESEEWYWVGPRDYFPPNYTQSTDSDGHNGADDAGANPT